MEQFALFRDNYHHLGRHAESRSSMFRTGLHSFGDGGPSDFKTAGDQNRCGSCNHPAEKTTPTMVDVLFESSVQAVLKSQRHINHSLVAKQLNNIPCAFQYRLATLALLEMSVHGCA